VKIQPQWVVKSRENKQTDVRKYITAVTLIKEVYSVRGFEAVEWTQLAQVLAQWQAVP